MVVAYIFLGILTGVSIGMVVAQFLIQKQTKNVLNNKQCKNCKHLAECQGSWRKSDANQNCKIYQENKEETTLLLTEEEVCLKDQLRKTNREVSKLGFVLDNLAEAHETDTEILAEDIERLERAIYDKGKDSELES